eukprot:1161589-Pelagomonas_calceolata.AAC.4
MLLIRNAIGHQQGRKCGKQKTCMLRTEHFDGCCAPTTCAAYQKVWLANFLRHQLIHCPQEPGLAHGKLMCLVWRCCWHHGKSEPVKTLHTIELSHQAGPKVEAERLVGLWGLFLSYKKPYIPICMRFVTAPQNVLIA